MRRLRKRLLVAAVPFAVLLSPTASAEKGDFLQTDTLGTSLVNRDLTARVTRTVGDAFNLSEYFGLHYFFVDRVRAGMALQFAERIAPALPPWQSRFQRFALLPQIGWKFYDPFFAAFVFAYAPRANGRAEPTFALQAAAGVALPVTERMNFSAALEVPWTFHPHEMLGLTALAGVSFRL